MNVVKVWDGGRGCCIKGHEGTLGSGKIVLFLGCGCGYTLVWFVETPKTLHQKILYIDAQETPGYQKLYTKNYTVCELSLNKTN